jgi:hypothetical protein
MTISHTSSDTTSVPSSSEARIDWSKGRLIGFSVPEHEHAAFDVVRLFLDGCCIHSAIANRSLFELAKDLVGLRLPSTELSAFELRVPQQSLLPGHLRSGEVVLELRSASDAVIFRHELQGPHELLRLTEGTPTDLMYRVRFQQVVDGAIHGIVEDIYGTGLRPALLVRFNDGPADPLSIYNSSADGGIHCFAVPLRADRLLGGVNHVHVQTPAGHTMASFPIQMGSVHPGETDRRLGALEAEVAFLKHLLLNQSSEAMNVRLALMKGEIVNICSDMLALQRVNLEREVLGQLRKGIQADNKPN